MAEEKDLKLVEGFKNGDEKAFNELVLLYEKKIYNLILRMVRNHQDAADLSMEVFVKAYQNLKHFEEKSSFYTWLYRIAVNLCINFSRREKFRSFLSIFDLQEKMATSNSPAEEMEKIELKRAIDQAIRSLPQRQKTVFVLKFYEKKSHQEIGKILGITEGAVKANYFQAIKKLQKFLAHYK